MELKPLKVLREKNPNYPEWTKLPSTEKKIGRSDQVVLGHQSVKSPAIISYSNIKGVKARLVSIKKSAANASKTIPSAESLVEVRKDWEFDEDNQTISVRFDPCLHIDKDFWVEMSNPTDTPAIVNGSIQCYITSKQF